MKYKIQEVEFEDGHIEYMPLIKLHWWSKWKRVDCWGTLHKYSIRDVYRSLDVAKENIREFLQKYRASKVKSVRRINVVVNIVEQENT